MLTKLIEEYARRYVEISVSSREHYAKEFRWRATVKPRSRYDFNGELPTFSFDASGNTADALAANTRRMLDLCEPIVAHREAHLSERERGVIARLKANPVLLEGGYLVPNTGAQS